MYQSIHHSSRLLQLGQCRSLVLGPKSSHGDHPVTVFLCPVHILAIGPMNLKFQDWPRVTLQCDCKFRYYDSTTTYWWWKPWLQITKIYPGHSFSFAAIPPQSSSIIVRYSHPLPFITFPSKTALFVVNPDRKSLCFVVIRSQLWSMGESWSILVNL